MPVCNRPSFLTRVDLWCCFFRLLSSQASGAGVDSAGKESIAAWTRGLEALQQPLPEAVEGMKLVIHELMAAASGIHRETAVASLAGDADRLVQVGTPLSIHILALVGGSGFAIFPPAIGGGDRLAGCAPVTSPPRV